MILPLKENIKKARDRRAIRIAKIITEGISQLVKNTSNQIFPDEIKQSLESFYTRTFQEVESVPEDEIVRKYERLRDRLT